MTIRNSPTSPPSPLNNLIYILIYVYYYLLFLFYLYLSPPQILIVICHYCHPSPHVSTPHTIAFLPRNIMFTIKQIFTS